MKDYRVRYWEQDGQESYVEFETMEQAQIFYNSLDGMAEIQKYVEEIHAYEAVVYPTFEFWGGMPMKKIDAKIAEIKKLQEEIDRRTKVEQEAEKLISQCRFEKAMELLATLYWKVVAATYEDVTQDNQIKQGIGVRKYRKF